MSFIIICQWILMPNAVHVRVAGLGNSINTLTGISRVINRRQNMIPSLYFWTLAWVIDKRFEKIKNFDFWRIPRLDENWIPLKRNPHTQYFNSFTQSKENLIEISRTLGNPRLWWKWKSRGPMTPGTTTCHLYYGQGSKTKALKSKTFFKANGGGREVTSCFQKGS